MSGDGQAVWVWMKTSFTHQRCTETEFIWYLCIGLEVRGEELLDFSSDKVVSPRVQLEQAMHKLQEGAQEVKCGVCGGCECEDVRV